MSLMLRRWLEEWCLLDGILESAGDRFKRFVISFGLLFGWLIEWILF